MPILGSYFHAKFRKGHVNFSEKIWEGLKCVEEIPDWVSYIDDSNDKPKEDRID